ncbi:MAG TPA: LytTR family DNA-binding domain-containing protein [Kofleriaceae bacterium]
MTRVFLVDDEPLALRRLARMLEATGRVEVAGQETDPHAAVAAIARATPPIDIVFLDISMPELDGFGVCAQLPPRVNVVFTTAHDEHALRAFEVNAIDYLMKPIRDDDLRRALDKLERLRAAPDAQAQLVAAMARIVAAAPERIASRLGDKIHLVDLERITHFVAEDKLTYAHTADRDYVVDPSISELETRFAATGYFRIHRATLVRLAAVVELHATTEGTRVRLADGKELTVARERVKGLKEKLGLV